MSKQMLNIRTVNVGDYLNHVVFGSVRVWGVNDVGAGGGIGTVVCVNPNGVFCTCPLDEFSQPDNPELKVGQRWYDSQHGLVYFISHIETEVDDEYPIKCMEFKEFDWEACRLVRLKYASFKHFRLLADGEEVPF